MEHYKSRTRSTSRLQLHKRKKRQILPILPKHRIQPRHPSGKIDAVWFLERKNDTTRRRALCHEVKSGHFDLDEIMKYENQSSILYDLAILPGHDTENPLWVWAWNNEIEKAKTRAAPETLEKVGEGIIRLNPLEIIEDLYRVVRGWL